jgi:hypothetical protein
MTADAKMPHTHGFWARFWFGKKRKSQPAAPLPGYIEEMMNPEHHTGDSRNDLGEFIRRRSVDERHTPRTSASSDA